MLTNQNIITFKQLDRLMRKRNLTPAAMAERFRGKFDNPRDFFERVMQGQYAGVAIPYRSVLQFYYASIGGQDMAKWVPQVRKNITFCGGVFSPPLSTP